jgi:hypothetical protein
MANLIAQQTVFATIDRKKAVKEGHPEAKFLLVREGHEISEADVEKHEGAAALVGSKASTEPVHEAQTAQRREDETPVKRRKKRK